jgi:TRAP transporter TAXI family solute receptor
MRNIYKLALISILSTPVFPSQFITIGTGGVTGMYYPTGGAICRFVNQYKKESKIRCSVESTDGSLYNLNTLKNGELDFGIVQSDIVYQASKGEGVFKNAKFPKLRSVMAIYPELLTLVTKKDANINKLLDIKGKRINLGNTGSGNETTTLALFSARGIDKSDLKQATIFGSSEMPDALKNNQIDGYFYMVGHPTANIKDAANSTDIKIIPFDNDILDSLVEKYPYFTKGFIPAGTYKNQPNDVATFGVKAVLVTNENVNENVVYLLVKAILENFDEFKKLHPAYENLTKESLLNGLSAPLHEGAKKYFEEAGLIK